MSKKTRTTTHGDVITGEAYLSLAEVHKMTITEKHGRKRHNVTSEFRILPVVPLVEGRDDVLQNNNTHSVRTSEDTSGPPQHIHPQCFPNETAAFDAYFFFLLFCVFFVVVFGKV